MIYDVIETKKYPGRELTIDVLAPQAGEYGHKPYEIININWDMPCKNFTPSDIRKIGTWLIKQADRIQEEYNGKGRPKTETDLKK